jgi:hypothetical protein
MGPSKRLKAESLNIAVISEEDFVNMIKWDYTSIDTPSYFLFLKESK